MDPFLSHSHLQQHGAASRFPHILVGDLCTGNGNNKVPSAPSPSLEKGFGEGSLPSIMAWELSSHCWVRSLLSFPVQMPEMAPAPWNLQEQSPIQHPLRLAGTRGHILALSLEGRCFAEAAEIQAAVQREPDSPGITCWKAALGSSASCFSSAMENIVSSPPEVEILGS